VGHTAVLGAQRATLGVAYYFNDKRNLIRLRETAVYSSRMPPPGWPLPPFVLDAMVAAGSGLPAVLTDSNGGRFREHGIEVSAGTRWRDVRIGGNYAWQKAPTGAATTVNAINIPPPHHVNVNLTYDRQRYYSTFAARYVGAATWRDVLDARFHGATPAWTRLDAGAGVRWAGGARVLAAQVVNVANRAIQHHVFGDVLKRQARVELRLRLSP
jgi:hypothetical protein